MIITQLSLDCYMIHMTVTWLSHYLPLPAGGWPCCGGSGTTGKHRAGPVSKTGDWSSTWRIPCELRAAGLHRCLGGRYKRDVWHISTDL